MTDEQDNELPWELGGGPVELEISEVIDLHSFRPKETKEVVEHWLEQAWEKGLRDLRVIHGRGIGTQRQIVRSLLSKNEKVESFSDAPPSEGGWGATVITLRD